MYGSGICFKEHVGETSREKDRFDLAFMDVDVKTRKKCLLPNARKGDQVWKRKCVGRKNKQFRVKVALYKNEVEREENARVLERCRSAVCTEWGHLEGMLLFADDNIGAEPILWVGKSVWKQKVVIKCEYKQGY